MTYANDAGSYVARLNEAFDRVVAWLLERGSISQFPRVVHYLGKNNGGAGWEDSYQNILIDRLVASRWMKKESDSFFVCTRDNSRWYRTSEEWRMLAYKQTLTSARSEAPRVALPMLGRPADETTVFFSTDFFRTAGFDPAEATRIDLNGIIRYLTTLVNGEFLDLSRAPKSNPKKNSLWASIRRAFGG
jgi:hypothetical protein